MKETKRLILRNFNITDSEKCFQNFGQDKIIGKYIPIFPFHSLHEMEGLIHSFCENPDIWLMIEKETDSPMGYITVDIPYKSLGIAEIGYVLGAKYQNKGFAKEAVSNLIEHLFINRGLYLIEAKVNETNTASIKLLEGIGFQKDAVLRERRMDIDTGKRNNLCVYSLLRSEYIFTS